jgi:hypothetical protein
MQYRLEDQPASDSHATGQHYAKEKPWLRAYE